MKLEAAVKRIEELERKVRELEARHPVQYHYHYAQPVYPSVFPPVFQPFCQPVTTTRALA